MTDSGPRAISDDDAEAIARDMAIIEAIGSGHHVFDEIEAAQAIKGQSLADALIALNQRGLIEPRRDGGGWMLTGVGRARMEALR